MNVGAATTGASPALPTWRDRVAWAKAADSFAVLIALFLP